VQESYTSLLSLYFHFFDDDQFFSAQNKNKKSFKNKNKNKIKRKRKGKEK